MQAEYLYKTLDLQQAHTLREVKPYQRITYRQNTACSVDLSAVIPYLVFCDTKQQQQRNPAIYRQVENRVTH